MASTATQFDTDCKLMLHMDGTDASTTFTDSSSSPKTMTANGDAQIDTAQSKFGGASGLFDGTGDFLSTPDLSDFDLGSSDFTVDMWIRFDPSFTNNHVFCSQLDTPNNRGYFFDYNTGLRFGYSTDGTVATQVVTTFAWTPSASTWYHVAFVRSGNNFYAFADGTQRGSTLNMTGVTIFNSTTSFRVGAVAVAGTASNFMYGWIDELRIVKGTAVWTANFTPPSAAYTAVSASTAKSLMALGVGN